MHCGRLNKVCTKYELTPCYAGSLSSNKQSLALHRHLLRNCRSGPKLQARPWVALLETPRSRVPSSWCIHFKLHSLTRPTDGERMRWQTPARCCEAGAALCKGRRPRWMGKWAAADCRWSARMRWAAALHLVLPGRCPYTSVLAVPPQENSLQQAARTH